MRFEDLSWLWKHSGMNSQNLIGLMSIFLVINCYIQEFVYPIISFTIATGVRRDKCDAMFIGCSLYDVDKHAQFISSKCLLPISFKFHNFKCHSFQSLSYLLRKSMAYGCERIQITNQEKKRLNRITIKIVDTGAGNEFSTVLQRFA